MFFLIGVIILIVFCLIVFFYFKISFNNMFKSFGVSPMKLSEVIKEARLDEQDTPKSLSSMDSVYLERIKKDFPDININDLKRKAETILLNCLKSIENKDTSDLKGKIKEFCDAIIDDNKGKNVKYDNIKIHNTVVSKYANDNGVVTIYFASSFEYYLNIDGKSVKKQDRVRFEYIYVYDINKVEESKKVLGIRCPNCGSPINSLGEKSCSYCGSVVKELIGRVFVCNDIVRY